MIGRRIEGHERAVFHPVTGQRPDESPMGDDQRAMPVVLRRHGVAKPPAACVQRRLALDRDWPPFLGDMVEPEPRPALPQRGRSEEHTYELPSLMRTSYAVFGLKKKRTE